MAGQAAASVVVIENGSLNIRAGLASAQNPSVIFPAVVGEPKLVGDTKRYVGQNALDNRALTILRRPIEFATIRDWEGAEQLWYHAYYDALKIAPEEHRVLMTEAFVTNKSSRVQNFQVLFETFNVPGACLMPSTSLPLYASGRVSGAVLDFGYSITQVGCVLEGERLSETCQRLNIGGGSIDEMVAKLLAQRGLILSTSTDLEIARAIKEKHCLLSEQNFCDQLPTGAAEDIVYELPDGSTITLDESVRKTPAEGLFLPSLFGFSCFGISELTYSSVYQCESDLRKTLFSNVVLAGGGSRLVGLSKRLQQELTTIVPAHTTVEVSLAAPNHISATWTGGAILASLSSFDSFCLSMAEYHEKGPPG